MIILVNRICESLYWRGLHANNVLSIKRFENCRNREQFLSLITPGAQIYCIVHDLTLLSNLPPLFPSLEISVTMSASNTKQIEVSGSSGLGIGRNPFPPPFFLPILSLFTFGVWFPFPGIVMWGFTAVYADISVPYSWPCEMAKRPY